MLVVLNLYITIFGGFRFQARDRLKAYRKSDALGDEPQSGEVVVTNPPSPTNKTHFCLVTRVRFLNEARLRRMKTLR